MSLIIPELRQYWLIHKIESINRTKFDIVSLHDWHPEDTDGKISLDEYLDSRIKGWLDVIAISDHNTLDTNFKAIEKTEQDEQSPFYNKIKIIPSLELSLGWQFPGHIILLDFDIQEFSSIFYEKYLFEYLLKGFSNKHKLSKQFLEDIESWKIRNFQPSQLENPQDTAYVLEAIISMKKDVVYEKLIFPWDSAEELFTKLLFHFSNWNLSKFPIIQIPHPALWKNTNITNIVWWKLAKHIKSLEKIGLTTYWWIVSSKAARNHILAQLKLLNIELENKWEKLNLLYEMFNDKDTSDKEWVTISNALWFKEIWAILCLWFDWHEEKTPELWMTLPKWVWIRDYINSKEFKEKHDREFQFVELDKWVNSKKLSQKVRELVSNLIFLHRWNTDPLCNEFPNLDPNQEWIETYHAINWLDTELVYWRPEMLNNSDTITEENIKDYKKSQKRWKRAKELQEKFIKSKEIK